MELHPVTPPRLNQQQRDQQKPGNIDITSNVDAMPALVERTTAPMLADAGARKPRAMSTFHAGAGVAKAGTCGCTTR
ncbi:hypothetical protein [Micromonospora sp. C81]|uniref:hypothetical protein n=1 Tax=Micromonospora sp. C81 TaxID=2824881 RepID=UPI001B366B8A|nr:hypothetical protein [Micromonospora sp. C81]MBQ1035772.1 hypothetical protein [Micromonospora sp. C81]